MTNDTPLLESELAQRRRLRRTMLVLALVAAGLVGLAVVFWPEKEPSPVIPIEEVASIEFNFQATSAGQTGLKGGATNPDFYRPIVNVLSSGRAGQDHKCADTGRIIIKLKDGAELHYGFLSGHDARFYEFRAYDDRGGYQLYRVPRASMAGALRKLGLERVDEPRPE